MKKWDTHYLATMKSTNSKLREYISKYVKSYLAEADKKEDNPFAAAEDGKDDEAPADKKGGDEKEDKETTPKKAEEPAGIPVKFNISKVKQYNNANFLSDKGIVKSIDKKGIVVTTQPDGVDVLVNFSDISESAKRFFKNRK